MPYARVEPFESIAERIANRPVIWCRLGATESEGRWQARLLELTAGESPPGWSDTRWEYPRALLFAFKRRGSALARSLSSRAIRIHSHQVMLDRLGDSATGERRQSGWVGGAYEPLGWPIDEWRFTASIATIPQSVAELISDSAPTFSSFDEAAASLLGVGFTGWNITGREFVFREQDLRGRLTGIRVRPAEVQADVDGLALGGAIVELAGYRPGPARRLSKGTPRTVRFALPRGLPDGAWIVLRKGDELLDYRLLSRPYTQEQPGVVHMLEPAAELEVLISGGETLTTEFKEELPRDDDASKKL
jgi:hypothetical protein